MAHLQQPASWLPLVTAGGSVQANVRSFVIVTQTVPVLGIYVVWHPQCQQAAGYARTIFTALCTDPEVPASRGLGMRVRFRTSLSSSETPSPVPFGRARHTAVFVLADDVLVADRAWRSYVDALTREAGRDDLVVPVAITDVANLPPGLAGLQAIRLNGAAKAEREVLLLNNVMHDICQLLDPGAAKVRVFLSHAKRDGLRITTAIRRYLHEVARLDEFFDAADIPDGTRFAEFLRARAGSLPALLAVQTDSYASREWCRLELLDAKRHGVPIVVVSALQRRESRSFPYIGNVPVVRWRGKESLPVVVGTLLGEVLRSRFFPKRADGIRMHHGLGSGWQVLTYPPELVTLLTARDEIRAGGSQAKCLYPDPPLGTEELQLLHQLEPGIDLVTPTVLLAL